MASDRPLRLVAWDENNPGLNVVELSKQEKSVGVQFSKSHIYYLGSYTGCSCGSSPQSNDGPEPAAKSREVLSKYVEEASESGPVELFICWEGDWEKPSEKRLSLTPKDLKDDKLWFQERVFITVHKAR